MLQSQSCTSLFDSASSSLGAERSSTESSAAPSATSSPMDVPITLNSLFTNLRQRQRHDSAGAGLFSTSLSSSSTSSNSPGPRGQASWQVRSSFLLPPNAASFTTRDFLEMAIRGTDSLGDSQDLSWSSSDDEDEDDDDTRYIVTADMPANKRSKHSPPQ
jgi:hypothetical protein